MRIKPECVSCGSRVGETEFPPPIRGRVRVCCDCADEMGRPPREATAAIRSRASYRAALRWRESLPQLDLIDPVVPRP